MSWVNTDGSLTSIAKKALQALLDMPMNAGDLAESVGRPASLGRRFARDLMNAGLIELVGERFDVTDLGREKLYKH